MNCAILKTKPIEVSLIEIDLKIVLSKLYIRKSDYYLKTKLSLVSVAADIIFLGPMCQADRV
jgi:hypothetical protein